MMAVYRRRHHQTIDQLLRRFDSEFLAENLILFGGGTRIALELGEFRESIDLDFFCVGKSSYRAARSQVTSNSFGGLLKSGSALPTFQNRSIRADRDAIRAFVDGGEFRPVKLEFIHFENESLGRDADYNQFPVPCMGRIGCVASKLTANADRYMNHSKDIVDLLVMRREWGDIPEPALAIADEEYGPAVIRNGLVEALNQLIQNRKSAENQLTEELGMSADLIRDLITIQAVAWLDELQSR